MNCPDSRRLLLAAPRSRTADLRSHVTHCVDCERLAEGLRALDADIGTAMLVRVPDALADRVLWTHGRGLRRRRAYLAAACACAAAAALLIVALIAAAA